jgi:DNA-binding NarL/FixJ family response regulator
VNIARPSPTERAAAALLALTALGGCALLAHMVGLGVGAMLLLLVPAALILLPARIAAEIVGTARRAGPLAALMKSAVKTVAEAGASLLAGAATLLAGAIIDMLDGRRVTDAHTQILIHDITPRREQLAALLRARLRAITSTIAARLLPAPRSAAHIRASA